MQHQPSEFLSDVPGARPVWEAASGFLQPEQYRWYHALLFGVAVNAVSSLSLIGRGNQQRFYNSQQQAPFAPPGWVFGPAWTLNNISTLWGNLALLNLPPSKPRRRLLWLQSASWFIFSTFSYVYFRKGSPILAFVWTASMFALTVASMIVGGKLDRKIVLSLVTLQIWLTLATALAAYQMVFNPDPVFKTDAWR